MNQTNLKSVSEMIETSFLRLLKNYFGCEKLYFDEHNFVKATKVKQINENITLIEYNDTFWGNIYRINFYLFLIYKFLNALFCYIQYFQFPKC